jgi:DNA gyrase/topoisomerase IV subunit A
MIHHYARHDYVMFITDTGRLHWLKAYKYQREQAV